MNHKNSRKIRLLLYAVCISMLLINSTLIVSRSRATPENAVYIVSPEPFDASIEGLIFNITVWFEGSLNNFFAYQIKLTVDDSMVAISQAWLPSWNTSWVFHGRTTVSPLPAFYDWDENERYESVKIGDTLLVEGIPATGKKLLAIIQLSAISNGQSNLVIDSPDTYILDADLAEAPITKQNRQITITGLEERESSQIEIQITQTEVFVRQNTTVTGRIIPDKPNEVVYIEISQFQDGIWMKRDDFSVRTNETSQFSFMYSFNETGEWRIRVSWIGDQTHEGAQSAVEIKVARPFTELMLTIVNQTELEIIRGGKHARATVSIGNEDGLLPTRPFTINVTAVNVTDLARWKVRIRYNPRCIRVTAIWLPVDNALNRTGLKYNVTGPYLGEDNSGSFFECEAYLRESGPGFTFEGNVTLLQFNITGRTPELTVMSFDVKNTYLQNSSRGNIYFMYVNLYQPTSPTSLEINIKGRLPTKIMVQNPVTGSNTFVFHTKKVQVGYRFNASIVIENATTLWGWRVKLGYNSTQLHAVRIIQPQKEGKYVFHGKEGNFTHNINEAAGEGIVTAKGMLSSTEQPFTGDGLLLLVEFEILLAPKEPVNKTESEVSCRLIISYSENLETAYYDGLEWLTPEYVDGTYAFRYGAEDADEFVINIVSIKEALPYLAPIIAGLIALYVVLKRIQKKREEIYIEE